MSKKARDILLYFATKYEGDYHQIISALRNKEKIEEEAYLHYQKEWEEVETLTIIDHDYPEIFKTINNPPIVLFMKGDTTLLNRPDKSIAVIGARDYSEYGKRKTFEFVESLVKEDYIIISGLARGIDSFAHEAALSHNGKTIAVLGGGINYPYPASNKKLYEKISNTGLIISEYPNLTKPLPDYFKYRNRLVAALSRGVLIIEAKYRSGTIITVGHALEKGGDIFCVPERAGVNSGCNKLIKDGAYLVENASDIFEQWLN